MVVKQRRRGTEGAVVRGQWRHCWLISEHFWNWSNQLGKSLSLHVMLIWKQSHLHSEAHNLPLPPAPSLYHWRALGCLDGWNSVKCESGKTLLLTQFYPPWIVLVVLWGGCPAGTGWGMWCRLAWSRHHLLMVTKTQNHPWELLRGLIFYVTVGLRIKALALRQTQSSARGHPPTWCPDWGK